MKFRLIPLTFALVFSAFSGALAAEKMHFVVSPLLPSASDTKAAYEPFFKYVAGKLGVDYTLDVATDFAGVALALASGQADIAWMGPWGYVLAHDKEPVEAVATAKYDGKPVYHAIIVARPDLDIKHWPEDGKGLRISFADTGSTSGWLIPTYWLKSRGIDP
ncbi:MAG TPA: PhnD/SsuA/transferrin family substrate-binding protein, partial [Stellaceae bacterium]|nr:PhnD/SsuA/transferrin family substrate-binding protein [Stellaceae bacterium]